MERHNKILSVLFLALLTSLVGTTHSASGYRAATQNLLHKSVLTGDIEAIEEYIEIYGHNINKEETDYPNRDDATHDTALHIAAEMGNIAVLKTLLQYDIKIDPKNLKSETPLHKAVESKNLEAVRLLLDSGAFWTIQDKSKQTAQAKAEAAGLTDIAQLIQNYNNTPAAERPRHTPTKTKPYASRKKRNKEWAFVGAAREGDVEEVIRLIDEGVDIDSYSNSGKTALHVAAEANDVEMIAKLLDRGAQRLPEKYSRKLPPIWNAVFYGSIDAVKALIGGADLHKLDEYGRSLLQYALANEVSHGPAIRNFLQLHMPSEQEIQPHREQQERAAQKSAESTQPPQETATLTGEPPHDPPSEQLHPPAQDEGITQTQEKPTVASPHAPTADGAGTPPKRERSLGEQAGIFALTAAGVGAAAYLLHRLYKKYWRRKPVELEEVNTAEEISIKRALETTGAPAE